MVDDIRPCYIIGEGIWHQVMVVKLVVEMHGIGGHAILYAVDLVSGMHAILYVEGIWLFSKKFLHVPPRKRQKKDKLLS